MEIDHSPSKSKATSENLRSYTLELVRSWDGTLTRQDRGEETREKHMKRGD